MSKTIPVVWTNDDIEAGKAPEMQRQLDFLERHGIPGVFFVIPHAKAGKVDLDEDAELVAMMRAAQKRGHEFYQHGHVHTAFECGVPDLEMLTVDQAAFNEFNTRREEIERGHTLGAQVKMLENGQRIWRRVFGENSVGFRPGWGAYCENFYRALGILGYDWVSSKIPCMTSWLWSIEKWDVPMLFREGMKTEPHLLSQGVWEYPMAGDYAFHVPSDAQKIRDMVDLGMREFEVFFERKHPMLLLSHYHGLEYLDSTGYAVNEELIPQLKKTGRTEFVGMKELVRRYAGAH